MCGFYYLYYYYYYIVRSLLMVVAVVHKFSTEFLTAYFMIVDYPDLHFLFFV